MLIPIRAPWRSAIPRRNVFTALAAEGWRLALKTKRLMERPEEGGALMAVAEATPGVVVVDRGLSREDMAALFAAADIYASPHRSEGFGLTIAEAMALGKPVVASDYGGSRDFLDGTCGYPVPVREVRLARDFGHYTRGGVWAEVARAMGSSTPVRPVRHESRCRRVESSFIGPAPCVCCDCRPIIAPDSRIA